MSHRLIDLRPRGDDRGSLIAIEDADVGFPIRRVYYMFRTGEGVTRGYHAHRALRQLAVAVRGSCTFILDDGHSRERVVLDDACKGLPIEHMIWREMTDFSPDCVLLVLASEPYDEADYIRDYDAFRVAAGVAAA